jgi:hypothetical protein
MNGKDDVLDNVESLLAYLICAQSKNINEDTYNPKKDVVGLFDAASELRFDPMKPNIVYTLDSTDDERLFSESYSDLLHTPQDLFGKQAEVAYLSEDHVKWSGYRKIHKRPKNIWVGAPGADLYEWHFRVVYLNGAESYQRTVVAFNKHGKPVPVVIVGSNGSGTMSNNKAAVIAASVIEDIHRPNALKATVKEDTSIIFPVPIGEHKEIFALREAPLTPTGRRKAILHWVKKHTRKTKHTSADVKQHWKGTREIVIDGLQIKLEEQS